MDMTIAGGGVRRLTGSLNDVQEAYDTNAVLLASHLTDSTIHTSQEGTQTLSITGTGAKTIDWDADLGKCAEVTIPVTSNTVTLANPTNLVNGNRYGLKIVQGSATNTIDSWGSDYLFAGGTPPTLTTTAAAIDNLSFIALGGKLICESVNLDVKATA